MNGPAPDAPATLAPAAPPAPPERLRLALAFAFASSIAFAAMGAFVRGLVGHSLGTAETVCGRGIVGTVVLVTVHLLTGRPLRVASTRLMLVRTIAGTISLTGYYGAIEGAASGGAGELATAVLLLKTAPVWVALGSRVFLGEVTSRRTWVALVIGTVGALAVFVKPEGISGGRSTVVLGLISGIGAAGAYLSVRKLAAKEDPLTVVAFFSIGLALFTAPFAAWHLAHAPVFPGLHEGGLVVGAALAGTTAQVLMTHAYRHARATIAAVAGLGEIGFALAAGILIFGERPEPWALAGGGLAVAAGIIATWPKRPRPS